MSGYTQGVRDGKADAARIHRERLRVLLETAGMDPLRDWDDLVNVIRCWRKQRESSGETEGPS